MSLVEVIVAAGVGANISAMAWIMTTLYQLRNEISGTHARHEQQLVSIETRLARLERIYE